MSLPTPIHAPSRAVLHHRSRLALSLLDQRPPTRATADIVRRALLGEFDQLAESTVDSNGAGAAPR